MGSYMIWRLEFKNKKAKDWFKRRFGKEYKLRLIHDHYEKSLGGYEKADFYYDAGYLGYAEAKMIIKECKQNGIIKFEQLYLCDTEDFKEVKE